MSHQAGAGAREPGQHLSVADRRDPRPATGDSPTSGADAHPDVRSRRNVSKLAFAVATPCSAPNPRIRVIPWGALTAYAASVTPRHLSWAAAGGCGARRPRPFAKEARCPPDREVPARHGRPAGGTATGVVELADGDRVHAAHRAGDQAHRRRDGADARLQRLHPRPDAAGAAGCRGPGRHRERGRHGEHRALARAAPGERFDGTHETQEPIPVGGRYTARVAFPDPGVYWYHPHIREDYNQELGLYGNVIVTPADPDYWAPVHREVELTLDDVLIEDGQIAPFSPDETTYAAMGRFGNVLLVARRARARADRAGRRGRAPLPDQHRQHARVPGRAARRADEARRRRQRPRRARAVRRGRRAGAVGACRSSTCCFETPGRAGAGAPHARADLQARRHHGQRRPATPSLAERSSCALTRNSPRSASGSRRCSTRRRTRRWPSWRRWTWASPTSATASPHLHVSDAPGGRLEAPGRCPKCGMKLIAQAAPTGYVCPMHPEVTGETADRCPQCGMKLLPARLVRSARGSRARRARAWRPP